MSHALALSLELCCYASRVLAVERVSSVPSIYCFISVVFVSLSVHVDRVSCSVGVNFNYHSFLSLMSGAPSIVLVSLYMSPSVVCVRRLSLFSLLRR